jgi:replication initiation protein RepC
MRLSIDELMMRAPRLRAHLKTPSPAWPEIVTADWLRGEMGVSKSRWGEACMTMGREQAAIRDRQRLGETGRAFPRSTPGGYLHGMVAKAKAGELNLSRTIWGLRQGAAPKPERAARACSKIAFSVTTGAATALALDAEVRGFDLGDAAADFLAGAFLAGAGRVATDTTRSW